MAIQAAREAVPCQLFLMRQTSFAVKKFLHEIRFLDIYDIIGQSVGRHKKAESPDLDEILAVENETSVD